MPNRRAALLLLAVLLIPLTPWLLIGPPMEGWINGALAAQASLTRGAVAGFGVALLAVDSFFPVPSTVVMSALGLGLGTLLGGACASLGVFLSGTVAYLACRRFGLGIARRIAGERGLERVQEAMQRLGPVAIAATRSVPVLQEASACLAGLVRMPPRSFFGALAVGSLPTGFAYAAVGASALRSPSLAIWLSILVPAATWPILFLVLRRAAKPGPAHANAVAQK